MGFFLDFKKSISSNKLILCCEDGIMDKRVIIKKSIMIFSIIIVLLFFSLMISDLGIDRPSIEHLSLSTDNSKLISISEYLPTDYGSSGRDVQLWDLNSGQKIWATNSGLGVSLIGSYTFLSPNGSHLVVYDLIYDVTSGINLFEEFLGSVNDWSKDGSKLAIDYNNYIEIWNTINFTKIKTISLNDSVWFPIRMRFSPDGEEIAYLSEGKKSIAILNLSTSNINCLENTSINFTKCPGRDVPKIRWSPDGSKIGLEYVHGNYSSIDYYIFIWNTLNGSLLQELHLNIDTLPIILCNFKKYGYLKTSIEHPDEYSTIIKGASFEIHNLTTGQKLLELEVGRLDTSVYECSYDGNILVTGNLDGTTKIWNVSTGKLLQSFTTSERAIYSHGFRGASRVCYLIFVLIGVIAIISIILWKRK